MSDLATTTNQPTSSGQPTSHLLARLWRLLQDYWVETPNTLIMGAWPYLAYRSARSLQWQRPIERHEMGTRQ